MRELAAQLGLRPTKTRGQNFVVDANTVRRVVRAAGLAPAAEVLEVGPGLGSLTLALLADGHPVTAVEIDPVLAAALPATIARYAPAQAGALAVVRGDALRITAADLAGAPTALVANLPYNVAVPCLLHLLATLPGLSRVLVMVQAEVADRLVAPPGSRTYGVPSVKARYFGIARRVGSVPPSVFWPAPRVDSALVALDRTAPPPDVTREAVFAVVDAAFAQRRKTLRTTLAVLAGSTAAAQALAIEAGVDPAARGEQLDLDAFAALARALPAAQP